MPRCAWRCRHGCASRRRSRISCPEEFPGNPPGLTRPGSTSDGWNDRKKRKDAMTGQLFTPLFASHEAAHLFYDRARLQGMLDFEAALARAEAKSGIIPREAVGAIEGRCRADLFDLAALAEATARAGNPAI